MNVQVRTCVPARLTSYALVKDSRRETFPAMNSKSNVAPGGTLVSVEHHNVHRGILTGVVN